MLNLMTRPSALSVRCHTVASLSLGTIRSPQFGPKVYALAMFVVVSVLAGLLVAGLAVPAAALVGTSTKYVAHGIESLPTELTIQPASDKTLILMSNGETLAQLYD